MDSDHRLITIPISHYCEKVRWALERAGIPYRESRHLQGFHYIFSFLAATQASVPVLQAPGVVLGDSAQILRYVDAKLAFGAKLFPLEIRHLVERFEAELNQGFGVAGRLWLYTYMIETPAAFLKVSREHGVPRIERWLMPIAVFLAKPFIRWRLKMNHESRARSKKFVDDTFDAVAKMREDGRRYLFGNHFTAADLTFAALAAPAILPRGYGVKLPALEDLPPEMAGQVRIWRAHPAGIYAQRLYDERRQF